MFQHFWRFAQICRKFAAFAHETVFVIVSVVNLFRNNSKNNFASKCCKFLANLCKSLEILEQCHVKWWLDYRTYGSVSYSFSCTNGGFIFFRFFTLMVSKVEICWKYLLNKNCQKQPLCSLYCRGRQRLSTEHHCEVRHGTLRLSTTLATEGIFQSSTNYTPQFNKKKFRLPIPIPKLEFGFRFQNAKTWFWSYTTKNIWRHILKLLLAASYFLSLVWISR